MGTSERQPPGHDARSFPWQTAIYSACIVAFAALALSQAFRPETPAAAGADSSVGDIGGLRIAYTVLLWVILPLGLFIWVNVKASRSFRERLIAAARNTSDGSAPGEDVEVPLVFAKTAGKSPATVEVDTYHSSGSSA